MKSQIEAHFVDIKNRTVYPAVLTMHNGMIESIEPVPDLPPDAPYLLPGFVDAHVHIESSMLPPYEFARMALVHGTVATVSDPHEIANVLGMDGVDFMLNDARRTPMKCWFGAPSCVPATDSETAGAVLDADAVKKLLESPEIGYLSEMMNFPGVIHGDPSVLAKIKAAKALGKPVDGHAPGLKGKEAQQYFSEGISTDHECFTLEEAMEKASLGVKILIREGSAARNFEAIWPVVKAYPDQVMFCSDDKHPDDLIKGHINQLVSRAVAKGCDLFDVLNAACLAPLAHYKIPSGRVQVDDSADFILVRDLAYFEVLETWIEGVKVAENGNTLLPRLTIETPNHFLANKKQPTDFYWEPGAQTQYLRAIEVFDGEIVTGEKRVEATDVDNPEKGLQYIAVLNRYATKATPALGLVYGFGLKSGAVASSVAHDSHNIVAVGTNAEALTIAINAVIEAKGGISATDGNGEVKIIPLPIGGLMSDEDGWLLAQQYADLDAWVKSELGCPLKAPFMSLSFLALPVIPKLKMTDKGLFDVEKFDFVRVEW